MMSKVQGERRKEPCPTGFTSTFRLHPSSFKTPITHHWTLVPVGSKYADVADRVARHGSW